MRKSSWILSLLLVVAFSAPKAQADNGYTITLYDGTSSVIDGTGSFDFSGGTFSNFMITVLPGTSNAITFNLTALANSTPVETHGCDGGLSISVFTYLTNADCQNGGLFPGDQAWSYGGQDTAPAVLVFDTLFNSFFTEATGPHLGGQLEGVFVVTEPEPGMMLLLLTGLIALAFVGQKRNVRGFKATS
jgi:hypothetical protein